jgi:hypothetical protein
MHTYPADLGEGAERLGVLLSRREDREQDSERAAEHRDIARRNGDKLLEEPEIALRRRSAGSWAGSRS